jgi:hypothetical protein
LKRYLERSEGIKQRIRTKGKRVSTLVLGRQSRQQRGKREWQRVMAKEQQRNDKGNGKGNGKGMAKE